jgi:hypothetical protein
MKLSSPFLRSLGWLAFGILALATLLVAARWLVMSGGHRETERRLALVKKHTPPGSAPSPSPTDSTVEPARTPLAQIPYFGAILTGGRNAWGEYSGQIDELHKFLESGSNKQRSGTPPDFRTRLRNMGIEVPDTMTEGQAAGEYLKLADRFSGLLTRWREAMAKGPFGETNDHRFPIISRAVSSLLAITTKARLLSGDSAGAWEDLQALKNTNARFAELYPGDPYSRNSLGKSITRLAQTGTHHGVRNIRHFFPQITMFTIHRT